MIEDGKNFNKYISQMRFSAILNSTDAKKISHIARLYKSDSHRCESKFYKEFEATGEDMVISIVDHKSSDLIEIKTDERTLLADCASLQSGKNLKVEVKKGCKATIEYPVKPQIISMTGVLTCRRENFGLNNDTWATM